MNERGAVFLIIAGLITLVAGSIGATVLVGTSLNSGTCPSEVHLNIDDERWEFDSTTGEFIFNYVRESEDHWYGNDDTCVFKKDDRMNFYYIDPDLPDDHEYKKLRLLTMVYRGRDIAHEKTTYFEAGFKFQVVEFLGDIDGDRYTLLEEEKKFLDLKMGKVFFTFDSKTGGNVILERLRIESVPKVIDLAKNRIASIPKALEAKQSESSSINEILKRTGEYTAPSEELSRIENLMSEFNVSPPEFYKGVDSTRIIIGPDYFDEASEDYKIQLFVNDIVATYAAKKGPMALQFSLLPVGTHTIKLVLTDSKGNLHTVEKPFIVKESKDFVKIPIALDFIANIQNLLDRLNTGQDAENYLSENMNFYTASILPDGKTYQKGNQYTTAQVIQFSNFDKSFYLDIDNPVGKEIYIELDDGEGGLKTYWGVFTVTTGDIVNR